MHASLLKPGQHITASFYFRRGHCGGDIDHATIVGTIIRRMECYNRILVKVREKESFNYPQNPVWINCDKAEISINNKIN